MHQANDERYFETDFTDALIDHIEQEQHERYLINLDNDLYEHSAE